MRVCLVGNGSSVHLQRWASGLAAQSVDVHVVTPEPYDGDRDGLGIYEVGAPAPSGSRLGRSRQRLAELLRVRRVVRALKPDVVHGHYLFRYGALAWLTGVRPLVLSAWGSDAFLYHSQRPVARLLVRGALRRAALVTADSDDLCRRLSELGVAEGHVRRVPFGIDGEVFRAEGTSRCLLRTLGVGHGATVVLSPRSVAPIYNIHTIVAAFARLPPTSHERVLIIKDYHGDPAYRSKIRAQIDELGLSETVRWLGECSPQDMAALYRESDVVVSVAVSDSAPVSIIEALACGSVVVAGDLPSVREWVAHERNGLLVQADDPASVASGVGRAIRLDAPTRRAWAEYNHLLTRPVLWPEVGRTMVMLYREILCRQARSSIR